jgi:hypothetical protein
MCEISALASYFIPTLLLNSFYCHCLVRQINILAGRLYHRNFRYVIYLLKNLEICLNVFIV